MKKFFIFNMLCLLMVFGFAPKAQAQSDCAISTFPYTEGFENGSLGSCYAVNTLGVINGILYPQVYEGTILPAHSGNYFLRCYNNLYSDTAAQVPTLILPPVDASISLYNLVLEFWALSNFQNSEGVSTGYFVVGVMDDPTDMSTFTPVQTFIPSVINEYVKYTAYFSNYSGTGQYIAIKLAATAYNMMRLDDIVLDETTPCLVL